MVIALIFFIILLFSSYIEIFRKKDISIFLYMFITIILILFAGLRTGGYDYQVYHDAYYSIINFEDIVGTNFELGFSFFMYIFRILNLSFSNFIFVVAMLSIGIKAYIFYKDFNTCKFTLMLTYYTIFYFGMELAQIRSGLCLSFSMVAIHYLIDSKYLKSIAFFVLGVLFHIEALALIPLYLLINVKSLKPIYMILFLSLCVSFIDLSQTLMFVNDNILHSDFLRIKIIDNFGTGDSIYNISNFYRVFIIITYYLIPNREQIKKYAIIYIYGFILALAFNQIELLAIRTSGLFKLYEVIILFTAISFLMSKKKLKKYAISIYIVFVLYNVAKFGLLMFDPVLNSIY